MQSLFSMLKPQTKATHFICQRRNISQQGSLISSSLTHCYQLVIWGGEGGLGSNFVRIKRMLIL